MELDKAEQLAIKHMEAMTDRGEHASVTEMQDKMEGVSRPHAMGFRAMLRAPTPEGEDSMVSPIWKTPIVIYHKNCADGFSAAWCFYHAQKNMQTNFEFHASNYDDPVPDIEDRIVYLVDFSYKRAVVQEICQKAKEVWLIDHHKTAIEDLLIIGDPNSKEHRYNFNMYVDLNRSGAMLAWDFLNNLHWAEITEEPANVPQLKMVGEYKPGDPEYNEPPILLEHVQDRDLWRFKLPGTREINAALFSYEYTFDNWDKLMLGSSGKTGQVVDKLNLWKEGAAIERKHFKDIAELLAITQRTMRIADYEVPVANLPYTFSSDAGHSMAKHFADGTMFAACYWDTATHRVFSLRSTERGMDVSAIAMKYNGGGHKHAAGFRVPRTHALAMV